MTTVRFRYSVLGKAFSGEGEVLRRGETLDGYCDAGAYILRVTKSDQPDLQVGEVVQCSLVYQVTP